MRCAALILGGVLLLALPAQAAHRTESKIRTIQLVSRTVSAKLVVDRAPKGLSKGDKISEKSSLRNAVPQFGRPKDAPVGSDVAVMTLISAVRTKITVTVTLPGGTIRTAGTVSDGRRKIPVVGGTGVFAGARGMSDVQSLSADDRLTLTSTACAFRSRRQQGAKQAHRRGRVGTASFGTFLERTTTYAMSATGAAKSIRTDAPAKRAPECHP